VRGKKKRRVEVSCFFLLLCAWLLYRDNSGMVVSALAACLLHELGHCAALLWAGNCVKQITITVLGAQIQPERPMNYRQELNVAAAGPAVNLMLALVFSRASGGAAFAGVNLALGVFNLLPVGELDGARILRSALAFAASDRTASAVYGCLEFYFTVIFAGAGMALAVRNRNLTLFFVSLWLLKRFGREKMMNLRKKNGNRACHTVRKPLK